MNPTSPQGRGTLLITANSPGEITWLGPIARAALERGLQVEVLLLPCSFASGREAEVARTLPGVAKVHPWSSYLPLLLWGGAAWDPQTRVIHLGGDLMYTAFLSWRWGWRCWSYLWSRPWWNSAFRGYLARDAASVDWLLKRKVPREKVHVVGDLVVDSVLGEVPEPAVVDPNLVALMPGSRRHELTGGTPLYLGVAEKLWKTRPNLRFRLMVSPFLVGGLEISRTLLEELLTQSPLPDVGGVKGRLEQVGQEYRLITPQGLAVEVIYHHHMQALAPAQLAISIPGTKTAEAAALGVPTLMVLPLNRPEHLPSIGLLGLLDFLPGGRRLKGKLIVRGRHKVGLLAQPNQRAGRMLMPEIIDVVNPDMIAQAAEDLLQAPQRLAEVRATLHSLYLPLRGAAQEMLRLALTSDLIPDSIHSNL